jgi:hypothetical protein
MPSRQSQPGLSRRAGRASEEPSFLALALANRYAILLLLFAGLFWCLSQLEIDPESAFGSDTLSQNAEQAIMEAPIIEEKEQTTTATADVVEAEPHHQNKEEEQPVIQQGGKLRYDWTNLEITSPLAKRILRHQSNCSFPLADFKWRNRFGLGSDLHVWSQAVCNAMEENVRIRTPLPWIWMDEEHCDSHTAERSSLLCYFPKSELLCEDDWKHDDLHATIDRSVPNPIHIKCNSLGIDKAEFRAASMEVIFRSVSPLVVREAERQLSLVFPGGKTPPNLITVQMRWGDKKAEMKLTGVAMYINAVKRILEQRLSTEGVHIFLATEDPKAVDAFQKAAPKSWNIYVDQYFHDMLPFRQKEDVYNQGPKVSRETKGRAGLIALGSLLVSMEANDYVLTTASNWSRMMNELRKNVLDPRCNNCTHMEDLKYGEW